jgi:hypothetical protein
VGTAVVAGTGAATGRATGGVLALRGVMVITKLGPLRAPPSEISMVALRSGFGFLKASDTKVIANPVSWLI